MYSTALLRTVALEHLRATFTPSTKPHASTMSSSAPRKEAGEGEPALRAAAQSTMAWRRDWMHALKLVR